MSAMRTTARDRCGARHEAPGGARVEELRESLATRGWAEQAERDLCADCARAAPDEAWPTPEAVAGADPDQLVRWYRSLPTADIPERATLARTISDRIVGNTHA